MKRFSYLILARSAIFTLTQCDDTTDTLGSSIVPDHDMVTARTDTFYAKSATIMANDSILANTSDVYLGKYTDEKDNTSFSSSFVTQFGCTEGFEFPSEGVIGDSATYTILRLYIDKYYGDSLNAMHCEVYALDKILEEAGFELRLPSCSSCLAMNPDKVPAGKLSISTSNRNFVGRQGPGARTILASPLVVAASAITGVVTDPRKLRP